MTKKERYEKVLAWFKQNMGKVETELHYGNPFQLLVAVMLSAQCTDKRVNMVTPALFAAYPDALAMSKASEEEILSYVKSVTYPNAWICNPDILNIRICNPPIITQFGHFSTITSNKPFIPA